MIPEESLQLLSIKSRTIFHQDLDSFFDSYYSFNHNDFPSYCGECRSIETCEAYGKIIGYSLVDVATFISNKSFSTSSSSQSSTSDEGILSTILLHCCQFITFTDNILSKDILYDLIEKCIKTISYCFKYNNNELILLPGGGCFEIYLSYLLNNDKILRNKIKMDSIESLNNFFPSSIPFLELWFDFITESLEELPMILCHKFIYPIVMRSAGEFPGCNGKLEGSITVKSVFTHWKENLYTSGVICHLENNLDHL